jgi:hypothetical protein
MRALKEGVEKSQRDKSEEIVQDVDFRALKILWERKFVPGQAPLTTDRHGSGRCWF